MTRRGRRVLWLALGLYIAAWGFGTDAMFPVAVGLALAPAAAWGWVRLLDRPMRLRRRAGHLELVEGQSFAVGLEVTADGGPLPVPGGCGRPGREAAGLGAGRPLGRMLRGRYEVVSAFRGRYRLGGAELVIGDGFGLAEARIALDRSDEVIVYPRVYPLEGLFTDAGGSSGEHGPGAASSHGRLRPALDPRPPAGREPAARPLALDGQAPEAHGEGAPGHAPRRGLGAARRRRPGSWPARRPSRPSTTRCAPRHRSCTASSSPASAARS